MCNIISHLLSQIIVVFQNILDVRGYYILLFYIILDFILYFDEHHHKIEIKHTFMSSIKIGFLELLLTVPPLLKIFLFYPQS
jgi:hypothetical protein